MKIFLVFLLVLACTNAKTLLKALEAARDEISALGKLKAQKPQDISFTCALCGIAMNEVEGFLSSNLTIEEIQDQIRTTVCAYLDGVELAMCNFLVDALPAVIEQITNTNSVSIICVDLGLCPKPFPNQPDMVPVPHVKLNLDLKPEDRWTEVCSMPAVVSNAQYLYNFIVTLLPGHGKNINELGVLINDYYYPSDYAAEIRGCATHLGIPYGWLAWFQLGYEVSDDCTSIISRDLKGTIYHARNLDFGVGMGFTTTLKNSTLQIDFQKGGKTIFAATTFGGYIGILSGAKAGGFSATVDTRFYPEGYYEQIYEIIAAIEEKNASLVSFLLRDTFETQSTYEQALAALSKDYLIADVYYIVGGLTAGAVISRNRTEAADVWTLDDKSPRWFEVETNYDHWEEPPWYDNRRDPAIANMNRMGQGNITVQNLFGILSQKPTLNLETTYSIVASASLGFFETYVRSCEYPCVQ